MRLPTPVPGRQRGLGRTARCRGLGVASALGLGLTLTSIAAANLGTPNRPPTAAVARMTTHRMPSGTPTPWTPSGTSANVPGAAAGDVDPDRVIPDEVSRGGVAPDLVAPSRPDQAAAGTASTEVTITLVDPRPGPPRHTVGGLGVGVIGAAGEDLAQGRDDNNQGDKDRKDTGGTVGDVAAGEANVAGGGVAGGGTGDGRASAGLGGAASLAGGAGGPAIGGLGSGAGGEPGVAGRHPRQDASGPDQGAGGVRAGVDPSTRPVNATGATGWIGAGAGVAALFGGLAALGLIALADRRRLGGGRRRR